jgi:hypothetical protein
MKEFTRDGVSFRFPSNWRAEAEESDDGWAVTVSSPDTAFAVISLRPDARDPADLADQTLEALMMDYKELDAESAMETIAGLPSIGFDADFLTVDTAIACRARCLDTPAGPLLLLSQVSEFDRDANDPVLRAIVASLKVEVD